MKKYNYFLLSTPGYPKCSAHNLIDGQNKKKRKLRDIFYSCYSLQSYAFFIHSSFFNELLDDFQDFYVSFKHKFYFLTKKKK